MTAPVGGQVGGPVGGQVWGQVGGPPRVLLIARDAHPDQGQAAQIGWSLARALTAVAQVHLATRACNRPALLREGLVEGRDFTTIDIPDLWPDPGLGLGPGVGQAPGPGTARAALAGLWQALAHPLFETLLWRRLGADIRAGRFDLVHRVTPLSPLVTSPIAARLRAAGVPFVLGPLTGDLSPDGPRSDAAGPWQALLRHLHGHLPGQARMLRSTDAILTQYRRVAESVSGPSRGRVIWLPATAIDPAAHTARARPAPGPLRACFIGRLAPDRGADLLLDAALPLLAGGRMVIDILGDGPQGPALRALVMAQGIDQTVRFHGRLPPDQARAIACRAAILASPGMGDSGGGVVLQAMALGLAPVVLAHGAAGDLVTPGVGWALPMADRTTLVTALRDRFEELAADPATVALHGDAARARARAHFTWAARARQIEQVYAFVLRKRDTAPVFFSETQPILSTGFDAKEEDARDVGI